LTVSDFLGFPILSFDGTMEDGLSFHRVVIRLVGDVGVDTAADSIITRYLGRPWSYSTDKSYSFGGIGEVYVIITDRVKINDGRTALVLAKRVVGNCLKRLYILKYFVKYNGTVS